MFVRPAEASTLPGLADSLALAEGLSRERLLQIAVNRGCRHYAAFAPQVGSSDAVPSLLHEVLGVALLRGRQEVDTFQAFRCGAMVLSDLGNDPALVFSAAEYFAVVARVSHIARLGLNGDSHRDYWARLLRLLPPCPTAEEAFWPGLSRLTSQTSLSPTNRKPASVWLRTSWPR